MPCAMLWWRPGGRVCRVACVWVAKCCVSLMPLLARCSAPPQRALLRTAQEVAKGMGYIHEFNVGEWEWVCTLGWCPPISFSRFDSRCCPRCCCCCCCSSW